MYTENVNEGKTIAIISYITFIGTIIAFIMNQNKRNSFASFHIRQATGLILLGLFVSFLSNYLHFGWAGNILSLGVFALWILGLVGAVQGEEKKIPFLGNQFQEWFKNIG